MTETDFRIRRAIWPLDRESLARVREQVFVHEQKVPPDLEWDGEDAAALHLLAEDRAGQPIGTARLLPDGHVGRMAVLAPWRNRGVGSALLGGVLRLAAEQGISRVFLNAQTSAVNFYEKHGFIPLGEEFLDAGIPHRRMELK